MLREPGGDHAEQDPPERGRQDGLQDASLVGRLTAGPEHPRAASIPITR